MALQLTDKIHTVSTDIDTANRGSAQANAGRAAYTLQDVSNLIGGGGGGAVDSIVAGNNVTISSATGDVTINAALGGSGLANQFAIFTANGTIGNGLLSASTSGGSNFITVGSGSAPVSLLLGTASNIIFQTQGSAPTSAATAGTAGQMVLYHGDQTDADNGIYVCVVAGAAGAAKWTKSALTNV
jgi:hypothetical protein